MSHRAGAPFIGDASKGAPERGAGAPFFGDATVQARITSAVLSGTLSPASGSHLPAEPAGTAPPSAGDDGGRRRESIEFAMAVMEAAA